MPPDPPRDACDCVPRHPTTFPSKKVGRYGSIDTLVTMDADMARKTAEVNVCEVSESQCGNEGWVLGEL